MTNTATQKYGWNVAIIYACCTIWICILLMSGYFERDVFVLHILQSLIYVAVMFLTLKRSKWGYTIGISIAVAWNFYNARNGFHQGFIFGAGFSRWREFIDGHGISNPVQFIAPIGWFAHIVLILALVWAYMKSENKRWRDILILLGGAAGTLGYFALAIAITWPQFVPKLRAFLHI